MSDPQDFREMIARAKAELAASQIDPLMQAVSQVPPGVIEPSNVEGVEMLARQLAAVKAQEAALKAVDTRLTAALKLVIGNNEGIRRGDQVLATVTRAHPVKLNVKLLTELFPYEQYPQYYLPTTEVVTLRVNPDLKAAVYDQPKEVQQ